MCDFHNSTDIFGQLFCIMHICAMPCFFRCHYITLHIDTLIFPAINLKIVGLHNLSLRAAWAWACHWLLGRLKEPKRQIVEGDNFQDKCSTIQCTIYLMCISSTYLLSGYKILATITKMSVESWKSYIVNACCLTVCSAGPGNDWFLVMILLHNMILYTLLLSS